MQSLTRRVPDLAPPSMEPAERVVSIVPMAASYSPEQDRWREFTRNSSASCRNSAHLLLVHRGAHSRVTPACTMGVQTYDGTRCRFAGSGRILAQDTRTCYSCLGPCECGSLTSTPCRARCIA